MKHFHGVEPRVGERWNSRIEAKLPGMCERRDPAGVVNDLDDRFRRRAFARDEAGPSAAEPAIEGLLRARHMSGVDHRARDLRPPDRPAALRGDVCSSIGSTSIGTPSAASRDRSPSTRAILAARCRQEERQPLVLRVEKVAEHVKVAARVDRGDFNAC